MKIEVGGFRRPQTADAEALSTLFTARRQGDAFIVAAGSDPIRRNLTGRLGAHGLDAINVRPRSLDLPDPATAALVVIAGGEPYAIARTEDERAHELAWIRAADDAGTPVLGIGHGARALADALGGQIEENVVTHHGWAFVDTIAPHQIPAGPWPTWQHDRIELPGSATVIAHNRLGPQAFRFGRHLGIQFHPEATPATVNRWAVTDPSGQRSAARRDPAAAAACSERLLSSFLTSL